MSSQTKMECEKKENGGWRKSAQQKMNRGVLFVVVVVETNNTALCLILRESC